MIEKLKNRIIDEDIANILSENLQWNELEGATVLVTGASGMIPSYVVYTLLGLNDTRGLGIKVLALVRNEKKARHVFGDILDRDDITLFVQDVAADINIDGPVDYIFHGASSARPKEHKAAPTSTIKANLIGSFNLLDIAVEKKTKAFILMSSSEVYGQPAADLKSISESDFGYLDCLNPRACYSEGKRAAETICASYGRVQADFAANVINGENIVMKSDGSSRRAYTYVGDAVSGMFYALLKGEPGAYNIADSGSIISIKQLAEAFISARPEKNLELVIDIDADTSKYNPAKFIGLDNGRIKSLGWSPKVSINEGVDRMIGYYENMEK